MYNPDGTPMVFTEIPCGRCIGCRLQYSRIWADRCMAEATLYESSYFVTLTYDNDHLPWSIRKVDEETGEIYGQSMTLVKRDVQLFMKRLRKNLDGDKVRFFMAGEYGTDSSRPHYHLLLFGLKLDDLTLYKKTPLGFNLYNSEFISKAWQYQGHVVIADVTWETCAYTARYIMKKLTGEQAELYKKLNIIPEFTLMSRKPGIAKEFYEINKLDYLQHGEVNISTPKGGRKIQNIKYFDKFLEIEYPDIMDEKKDKQKENMEVIKQAKLAQTNRSYLQMLNDEEEVKRARIKNLKRKEI